MSGKNCEGKGRGEGNALLSEVPEDLKDLDLLESEREDNLDTREEKGDCGD